MGRRDRAYFLAFAVALVLCWLPFKWAGYLAPGFSVTWVIVAGRSGEVFRRAIGAGLLGLAWVFACWLWNERFVLSSGILFLITHSSLALIWLFPAGELRNSLLLVRMTSLVCKMVLLQGIFGITQAIYGYTQKGTFDRDNGDIVQGTLYPFLRAEGSFANPMYGASMTLMILSLIYGVRLRKLHLTAVMIGAIAVVLGSVVHQLIFLFAAFCLAYLWVRPRFRLKQRHLIGMVLVVVVVPLLSAFLLSGNLSTTTAMVADFLAGRSPRSAVVRSVITDMRDEYPYLPLVGVGPGQFGSRAALMNTGLFFGSPRSPKDYSPILQNVVPDPMEGFLLQTWIANDGNPYYGSTQKPFFSWLSLYAETGLAGILVLGGVVLTALARLPRSHRAPHGGLPAFVCATMVWFLALLGFQENYWEVPQAILPGLILTKVIHAHLSHMHRSIARKKASHVV